MNKKNTKILVILIICLALYALFIIFFVNNKEDNNTEVYDDLLIIDNISTWKYDNNTWSKSTYKNSNKKYITYVNNNYLGTYYLRNNVNLYNENGNNVPYNGDLFCYSNELNIKLKSYTKTKVNNTDIDTINSILSDSFNYNDFSLNEKIIVDIDNNGINDSIISVSNLDTLEEQSKYFNLVYVNMNGVTNKIIIDSIIGENDLFDIPIYNTKYIFEIDNINYFVLQEGYFSEAGSTTNLLYKYNNNNFENIL